MDTSIGVVGPHDLVDSVAAVCEELPNVRVHRFDYDHESQAAELVSTHSGGVDGWLFTGIVPYTMAQDVLTRPAAFVDYSGSTLLQALVRLLRDGQDVTQLSIDTLEARHVYDTLAEAGVPTDDVRVMPYQPGSTSGEFAVFHRRNARRPGAVAVTCVSSVHDELAGDIPAFRLAPLPQSVRVALRQLLLTATNQIQEDAQVAIGLVEIDSATDRDTDPSDLPREVGALGGSLSHYSPTTSLIVTTRGPLQDASHGFTALPMLHRLGQVHDTVRIGFGLGHSGAEAERLARRALSRARSHGPIAAVVSLRNDVDVTLDTATRTESTGPPELSRAVVASRVGLSTDTLDRLREVTSSVGDRALTTRDIADGLGVQLRTARRILQRLEMAGFAERSGNEESGTIGRPLTLYQLTI